MIDTNKYMKSVKSFGVKDMTKISVSSLIYNNNILEMLPTIIDSGADFLHLDIMDGTLTENSTLNFETVREINNNTTFFLDAHLMIKQPSLDLLRKYILAGVNILTIHFEAFEDKEELKKALEYLKENKVIVGLSICIDTPIDEILGFKDYFDLLLIMSVEIGKYGQIFNEQAIEKLTKAKEKLADKLIEVDGGISENNIKLLKEKGTDIVVVGSSFKNAENKKEFITNLKK